MSTAARPQSDTSQAALEPMVPSPYEVAARVPENDDSATLRLRPLGAPRPGPRPGQFMMLYAFGVGEVAISLSGVPEDGDGVLTHTIRDVGAVSGALYRAGPGTVIGVRGPFGTGWELESAAGGDVVIVAGGVGLAPLRPVVLATLAQRSRYRRVVLISGARSPADFLFEHEQQEWAALEAIELWRTIDVPASGWGGGVGFVTEPLARMWVDPARTTAFLCGPEVMMRFCAQTLIRKGVPPSAIRVSLERNMKCGVGLCGHCQLGELLVCRDGPVVGYDVAESLLSLQEL
jgi:NAD(P)H-flavin reductase